MDVVVNVGIWSIVGVVLLALATGLAMGMLARRRKDAEAALTAFQDANRWCGLLHGQLRSIGDSEDSVAGRAINDAKECYGRAIAKLEAAGSQAEFDEVRRDATLGLRYVGVARARLGLVAGPQGPPPLTSDGRPMYEAGYRAVPTATKARDGDDRYEKPSKRAVSGLPRVTGGS